MGLAGTLILGAFVWPALAVGGAVAVGAPILIHLLNRRRFKRVRWAAVEFLLEAERRNRRRVRMEQWLLLLLRCLAVLLVGLLLARPFLSPKGLAALVGGGERTDRIFVLDDSFSMAYAGDEGSPFEDAKTSIRRVIELTRQAAPNDTVTILRTSDLDSPVVAGTFLDVEQTEQILARLTALTPSETAPDLAEVVAALRKRLDEDANILNATVYFVGDFQRRDWLDRTADAARQPTAGAGAENDKSASVLSPLISWMDQAGREEALRLVMIDVGRPEANNSAVTELTAGDSRALAGVSGSIEVSLANYSSAGRDKMLLEVAVGPLAKKAETIDELGPGQSISTQLDVTFPRSGPEWVAVAMEPDRLPIDDRRSMALTVSESIKILVVDGEPSADMFDDEVHLLTTALRPAGDVFSGNDVRVIDETQLEDANFADYHVVILANVFRLSASTAESLERYVSNGGGVIFFMGDQVDIDLYNDALYRDGAGFLPGRLVEVRRGAGGLSHLTLEAEGHPLVRAMAPAGAVLGLREAAFESFIAIEPHERAEDADDIDIDASRSATVLARFDDAQSTPALVERRFGRGRVLLLGSSADKEWNNLADFPVYLVTLMEMTQYVARSDSTRDELLVGAPIEWAIDPGLYDPDALVRTPAYPDEPEIAVTAGPIEGRDGIWVRWEQTDRSGVYQLVLRRRDGSEEVRFAAVNVDATESDLAKVDEVGLRTALPGVAFDYVRGVDAMASPDEQGRKEFWPAVLIALAAVLMGEQFLAWWLGRN